MRIRFPFLLHSWRNFFHKLVSNFLNSPFNHIERRRLVKRWGKLDAVTQFVTPADRKSSKRCRALKWCRVLMLWTIDMSGGGAGNIETVPRQPIVTIPGDGEPQRVQVAMDWEASERRRERRR